MKKIYEAPILLLSVFEVEDVLTLSIPDFNMEGIEDYGGITGS